jgi:hypothetical protein
MRKSFKVATAFTGTAAAAAMFAPAAGAATVTPDVSHFNCNAPTFFGTVLYRPASAHHGPTCVSSSRGNLPGRTNLGNTYFQYFCAGNYSGNIIFPDRAARHYGPGQGTGTLNDNVTSVSLTRFFASTGYHCKA